MGHIDGPTMANPKDPGRSGVLSPSYAMCAGAFRGTLYIWAAARGITQSVFLCPACRCGDKARTVRVEGVLVRRLPLAAWALCPAWSPKVPQAAQHMIDVAVRHPARPYACLCGVYETLGAVSWTGIL